MNNDIEFRTIQEAVFGFTEAGIYIGDSRENVKQHIVWAEVNQEFYDRPEEQDPYTTALLQKWKIRDGDPIATTAKVGFYEGEKGTVIVAPEDQRRNWMITGVGETEHEALQDFIFSANHQHLLGEIQPSEAGENV